MARRKVKSNVTEFPLRKKGVRCFVLAKGCALTGTKRGLVSEGDLVTADDFIEGQLGVDKWVSRGFLVPIEDE